VKNAVTLDLGAIALSMLHVEGWSDRLRYVRSGPRRLGPRWLTV